ncbi:Y-family DNA polymerase [soil metagenome]
MLALVDGNNFYVSCERVFAPHLRDRPVVVLSSNDGACIARSNEAKALGVEMAQPWFQVRHLEKSAGLIAVSANFELYGDMSARMMAIEARYAPRQEIYSIDESFLDFDGVRGDLVTIGRSLRKAVFREIGIPTCVGFGPTKTLAKFANHVAKTAERTAGSYPDHLRRVCDVGSLAQAEREQLFAATRVRSIWGIGKKTAEKLDAAGVQSVLDLVRCDDAMMRKAHGVVVGKTLLELRGTPCLSIDDVQSARQQILVSRSFGRAVTEIDVIVEAVSEFMSRAAETLPSQGSAAGAIQVFFSTSPYRKNERQHEARCVTPLVRPSADTRALVTAATDAVRRSFRAGFNYVKAGVILMDLRSAAEHQGELDLLSALDAGESGAQVVDRASLMSALDGLNQRFGRDAVRIGSSALVSAGARARSYAGKRERRSPRYTTRWDEVPVVR